MAEPDRHVRRSGSDYARAFAELLPTGEAWSRDSDSALQRYVRGQAEIWGAVVDDRAADLIATEADPRSAAELLGEWERAFGLPEPCYPLAATVGQRRRDLVAKITRQGAQSRAWFYGLADTWQTTIRIEEYSPFKLGVSRCGDTRASGTAGQPYRWSLGPPEQRFTWKVRVWGRAISRFRCGVSRCGMTRLVAIDRDLRLECLFNQYKPAHTHVVFDYENVTPRRYAANYFRCGVSRAGTDKIMRLSLSGGAPLPPSFFPLYP